MNKEFEILKIIYNSKNNTPYVSEDFSSLKRKGYDKSDVLKLNKKNLIEWSGSDFYVTEKGESVLREHETLEELKKQNYKKEGIIFDSNIYDLIADGTFNINMLSGKKEDFEFYITHIQTDEINKCPDEDKRARLILFMTKLSPIVIPTESGIWGTSRWGEFKWGGGEIAKKIKGENQKHIEDSLIGEVAIKNNLLLITEDIRLKNKVNSLNGKAINFGEFKERFR